MPLPPYLLHKSSVCGHVTQAIPQIGQYCLVASTLSHIAVLLSYQGITRRMVCDSHIEPYSYSGFLSRHQSQNSIIITVNMHYQIIFPKLYWSTFLFIPNERLLQPSPQPRHTHFWGWHILHLALKNLCLHQVCRYWKKTELQQAGNSIEIMMP